MNVCVYVSTLHVCKWMYTTANMWRSEDNSGVGFTSHLVLSRVSLLWFVTAYSKHAVPQASGSSAVSLSLLEQLQEHTVLVLVSLCSRTATGAHCACVAVFQSSHSGACAWQGLH